MSEPKVMRSKRMQTLFEVCKYRRERTARVKEHLQDCPSCVPHSLHGNANSYSSGYLQGQSDELDAMIRQIDKADKGILD